MSQNAKKSMIGRQFGRLTVVRFVEEKSHVTFWECKCSCGNTKIVRDGNLCNGHTQSCGCLQRERAAEHNTTHNREPFRLYRAYCHLKERCNNPKVRNHKNYGSRGIKVCEEWNTFEAFRDWALSNGYSSTLTIDRIDNDGDYSPSNCRWTNIYEQANNKRSNHKVTINEITKNVTQWAREYGINPSIVFDRLNRGWEEIEAITTPIGEKRNR